MKKNKSNKNFSLNKGQRLWKRAKATILGGNSLLSKNPNLFLPNKWPTYFSKSKGCKVWDLDNNSYVDMSLMGVGTNILGYSNSEVDNVVKKVIKKGNLTTLNCPEEVFLAEKLLNIHAPEAQKKVIGFDTFGKPFADSLLDYEKESAKDFVDESNFEGISTNDLYEKAEKANLRERIELVSGDITETAEEYTKNNTGFRISLLNLDFDTYQGTKSALEAFFPYI